MNAQYLANSLELSSNSLGFLENFVFFLLTRVEMYWSEIQMKGVCTKNNGQNASTSFAWRNEVSKNWQGIKEKEEKQCKKRESG